MQVLHGEMQLRDETREMEEIRPALQPDEYEDKVAPLELTQSDLREKTDEIISDILELPEGSKKFGKEIQLS